MRVRRDINSIPARSARETWDSIVSLVSGTDSIDAGKLAAAGSVIVTIITDENPATKPFILEGVGPQLRIYCRYGFGAVNDDGSVDSLTWNPTAGDWVLHVPCDAANLGWVGKALAQISPRLRAFDMSEEDRAEESSTSDASEIVVDWNVKG